MPFISYVLGTDLSFEKCLPDTLKEEGGYSNDIHDPGGRTMEGITQKEYDLKRRAWGLPTRWVRQISADEMRTIYYNDYWLPHCQLLVTPIALCLFDTNVNNGVHAGMVILQRSLGIHDDGVYGPQTVKALQNVTDIRKFVEAYCDRRGAYYRTLRNFQYFGKDWIRRDSDILIWAKGMI